MWFLISIHVLGRWVWVVSTWPFQTSMPPIVTTKLGYFFIPETPKVMLLMQLLQVNLPPLTNFWIIPNGIVKVSWYIIFIKVSWVWVEDRLYLIYYPYIMHILIKTFSIFFFFFRKISSQLEKNLKHLYWPINCIVY